MDISDKTDILLELGEVSLNTDWHDYLDYGFDETDVPALLEVLTDPDLAQASSVSKEVWAPLHAWRALGQIGSAAAIAPLIAQFDTLYDDDWALSELSKVMGMIGREAMGSLNAYMLEHHHAEFARVMAMDSLAEIAKQQPECRQPVIHYYQAYMSSPDESVGTFNGLLIGQLMDLDAREAIDEIRAMFAKNCVDITCAGDLEEVEIQLGFRTERTTPTPDYASLHGLDLNAILGLQKPTDDDIVELLDYYLLRYGHDESILDASELNGFCTALVCAPEIIPPSRWMAAIWGGEAQMPEWQNKQELNEFSSALVAFYDHVMQSLNDDAFLALFLKAEVDGETHSIVDEWCEGFVRGFALWQPLQPKDALLAEECLQPILLFTSDEGFDQLDAMSEDEVIAQQDLIEPGVRRLFQHFLEQRRLAFAPYTRNTPKTGRNDPCPCGSGKKFKKCCLH